MERILNFLFRVFIAQDFDIEEILDDVNICTFQNLAAFRAHAHRDYLALGLNWLHHNGILTQENFDTIVGFPNPERIARALIYFHRANFLNAETRATLMSHIRPEYLVMAMMYLNHYDLLDEANFYDIARYHDPRYLCRALVDLLQAGLLNQYNRQLLFTHSHSLNLASAISKLKQFGLLNQENFQIITKYANSYLFALAIIDLNHVGLLNPEVRGFLDNHPEPEHLSVALHYLYRAGLLNEAYFRDLVNPLHVVLLHQEIIHLIWNRFPMNPFPADLLSRHWPAILIAARGPHPIMVLQRLCHRLIGFDALEGEDRFNPRQSTHTASIHRTVSDAARRLSITYSDVNPASELADLEQQLCRNKESSFTYQVAWRALQRIREADTHFVDGSDISIPTLVALVYRAIRDGSKRLGSYSDAWDSLVSGLYEIQRGYNLNAIGEDNRIEVDNPICWAGTFNKLLEKLHGIHADVDIKYITREGAQRKFPLLVKHYALVYLGSLVQPKSAFAYQWVLCQLLRLHKEENIEPIWPNIKSKVITEIWQEFQEAYHGNPQDSHFMELVDNAEYCPSPDLSSLWRDLHHSRGFFKYQVHASMVQQKLLTHLCFWSRDSEESIVEHKCLQRS